MNLSRNAGGTVTTCAQAWAALCTSTADRMLPTMIFAGEPQRSSHSRTARTRPGASPPLARDTAGKDAHVRRAGLGAQHRLAVGEAGRQVDPDPLALQPA